MWLLLAVYTGAGLFFIWFEIRSCRRLIRRHKEMYVFNTSVPGCKNAHRRPVRSGIFGELAKRLWRLPQAP